MRTDDALAVARTVADAVLYEGYLLYPYRASAGKNQVRWQFGVLGPPGAVEAGAGEEPTMTTECLLEVDDENAAEVDVQVRFLQVQLRVVERVADAATVDAGSDPAAQAGAQRFVPTDELDVGGVSWVRWHEAVERELTFVGLPLSDLSVPTRLALDLTGGEEVELLRDEAGMVVGRLVRTRFPLSGELELSVRPAPGSDRLRVVRAHLANDTAWRPDTDAPNNGARVDRPRDEAARASFVGTHLLLVAHGGGFLSSTDPPTHAADAAAACTNHRCWPVLAGEEGSRAVVLASPIILPDHAGVAPESPGELYDSTEIDEILTLRIMTLTDEEKIAARGTDPRAAAIIDRSDAMPPEVFERLHGALRSFGPVTGDAADGRVAADDTIADSEFDVPTYSTPRSNAPASEAMPPEAMPPPAKPPKQMPWWDPGVDASVRPDRDTVQIGAVAVAKGTRVRLTPRRRADAHDLFLAGRTAVVAGVFFDVDDETHIAVTLEDDPASEFHEWYGRYYYFGPEELEPLPAASAGAPS